MIKNKVNVLGTDYTIEVVKISECELLRERKWSGSCNSVLRRILVGDASEVEFFGKMSKEEQDLCTKQILRHEITHAFLFESGLQDCTVIVEGGWSNNEEMVDWIANQFPKMLKAFQEVGCI